MRLAISGLLGEKVVFKISNLQSSKGFDKKRVELILRNPKDDVGHLLLASGLRMTLRLPPLAELDGHEGQATGFSLCTSDFYGL